MKKQKFSAKKEQKKLIVREISLKNKLFVLILPNNFDIFNM